MAKGASLRDRAAAADAVEPVVSSKASIPSAWPFLGYAPGNYMGDCHVCGVTQDNLDKRAWQCLECAVREAKALIAGQRAELDQLDRWRDERRAALNNLIIAAATFWGAGSEQHNLVRDVADAVFRDSDGTAAAAANGDLPVPQDCQARAESIAQDRDTIND